MTISYDSPTSATWQIWTSTSTTATTSATSVWHSWQIYDSPDLTASPTAGYATTGTTAIWNIWSDGYRLGYQPFQPYSQPAPLTAEQMETNRLDAIAAQQERDRLDKERIAAEKKAEDLLLENLAKNQKKHWKQAQEFIVLSQSGRKFKITNKRSQNVLELDSHGRRIASHCIVRNDVPLPDQLLMQKLLLEHDYEGFMRTANHFS